MEFVGGVYGIGALCLGAFSPGPSLCSQVFMGGVYGEFVWSLCGVCVDFVGGVYGIGDVGERECQDCGVLRGRWGCVCVEFMGENAGEVEEGRRGWGMGL